jgi:15,16-dihydrobiliverdin:ferredoxin oxidoreductase
MKSSTTTAPRTTCLVTLLHSLVALVVVVPSLAYAPSSSLSSSFVPSLSGAAFASRTRQTSQVVRGAASSSLSSSSMRMDLERPETTLATARWQLEQLLMRGESYSSSSVRPTVDEEQAKHGMPWQQSIDPAYKDDQLLYMKFWEWQIQFMKDNLTNLKVESCSNGDTDFSYCDNAHKKARIVSMCLSSDEYRKIRLTYYDAGDNAQVFNAVLYPDAKYNLPVLGVDVLAFNRKKYLAIVDFQPLHADESMHASQYEHLLQPIKEQYDNLKGQMSSKFYDETQFFSKQMLFSRFENESIIGDELFPAFQRYVRAHLQLVRDTPADLANAPRVLERQEAYDAYSAERDPATGLFSAMFGADWAQGFVHDFLFSLSRRGPVAKDEKEAVASSASQQHHQQQHAPKAPQHAADAVVPEAVVAPRGVRQHAFVQQRRR